jgi:RNA polymerase sigma-70 factor (ECF subfamily)
MKPVDQKKHDQFLHLYVETESSLRGFIRSLVPSLEDAKEVMQGTAAVLWRKFDQLDSPENFRRWAFGVARFEVLSFRRDQARDRHVFSEKLVLQLAKEAENELELFDREEEALEKCIRKLPEKNRSLVKEAYYTGTKIDQIAKRANRTPMSLYKALHRIRIALADCVRNDLNKQEGFV